jgi:tetratricopeptide (TPR) repeat protein
VVTANHTRAKNTEPLYYLGLILYHQGQYREAYEWLQKAAWSHAWVSPALYLCGLIDCMNNEPERALDNLYRSYRENNLNVEAMDLITIVLRRTGNTPEAKTAALSALDIDPVDFIALYEIARLSENKTLQTTAEARKRDFLMTLRNDPDNYLETASRYISAGYYDDALAILQLAAGSTNARLAEYPMVHYGIGYCHAAMHHPDAARASFRKASGLPTDYCFPYGTHQLSLLGKALEMNPEDAAAWYYTGNIYADFQPQKAIQCWENAVRINPDMAIAWRNLAGLYAHRKNDIHKAVELIDKAMLLNPDDPQYLIEADMYYGYAGITVDRRLRLFTDHREAIGKTDAATVKYNNLLVFSGGYDDVLKSMKTRNFHAYERFNTNHHVTWVDANVLEGLSLLKRKKPGEAIPLFEAALTFPRNLEIAEDSKAGIALYYLGLSYKMLGDVEKAKEYFLQSSSGSKGSRWAGNDWPEVMYSRALAFQELGQKDKAEEIFSNLIADAENIMNVKPNPVACTEGVEYQWEKRIQLARAYYMLALGNLGLGDKTKATELFGKSLATEPSFLSAKSYRFE